VGQQPQGIAVGDFNMDGKPDLALANSGSGDISVLLGNGDGTFQLAVNYASGNSLPFGLAIGDFNNDGIPDLAVATAIGGKIGILLGNGDGTFKPSKVFSVGLSGNPKSLLVLDLNNDGKADLASIGPSGAVIVLIGSGDGTFQTSAQLVTGVALAITAGDFNLDGKPDLAVGTNSGLFVLLGNGDGSLQPPVPVTLSDSAWDLTVGDFNGDGFPDLVDVNGGANLHLFPGNGDGSFQGPTTLNTGGSPQQVSVADFNRDGRPDLAIVVGPRFAGLHVALGLLQGPPSKLVFSTQPSNGIVGMPIAPVAVQIQDQYGNLVTQVDESITVTSSPSGILTVVNTQNGVANLNSLTFSAPGTYTLTASAPGVTPATSNSFTLTTATASPNVVIDSPTPGTVISSGTVVLTGWALDNISAIGTAVTSVQVKVDGVFIGNAAYGTSRPDVCGAYAGRPGCPNVGFTYSVSLALLNPGSHTITVLATDSDASPNVGSANVNITVAPLVMESTKVGVFRAGSQFLEDVNGNGSVDGPDRFLTTFAPPGGLQAGDLAIVGDWTGDGRAKAGYYRPSAGTWWLDANNDGSFGAGDYTYGFGGLPGDIPVVGDWNGVAGVSTHKSCIGIYRTQGSVWLLDLNCNGSFENTPTDALFPFGGLAGDVPVVGNFTDGTTRVGVVRKYAPAGVPQGEPFFWVYDAGNASAGNDPANHPPAAASAFPFGGLPGDQFVVGDWLDTGTARAGVYRGGLWVLDSNGLHNPDLILSYGGLLSDKAVTGKW